MVFPCSETKRLFAAGWQKDTVKIWHQQTLAVGVEKIQFL